MSLKFQLEDYFFQTYLHALLQPDFVTEVSLQNLV